MVGSYLVSHLKVDRWHFWSKQVDKDAGVDGLHEYPFVDGLVWVVDTIEGEVGSRLSPGLELDPHGDRQLLLGPRVEDEGNDKGSRGRLLRVGEAKVVVDVDVLAAVFTRQVERATAVEVVGQIDAGRRGSANAGLAVIHIVLAVFTLVAWAEKNTMIIFVIFP